MKEKVCNSFQEMFETLKQTNPDMITNKTGKPIQYHYLIRQKNGKTSTLTSHEERKLGSIWIDINYDECVSDWDKPKKIEWKIVKLLSTI